MILSEYYDKDKQYIIAITRCRGCNKTTNLRKSAFLKRKYSLCSPCYQKSKFRSIVSKKIVKNRRDYCGPDNPNYKGKIAKTCLCGKDFQVTKHREKSAIYCSNSCRYEFHVPKTKFVEYKGIRFRSTWEIAFAKYLDEKGFSWEYEPIKVRTSVGNYIPDFWVEEYKSYVEVKGYFRDDAEQKYLEASEQVPILLFCKKELMDLGIKVR